MGYTVAELEREFTIDRLLNENNRLEVEEARGSVGTLADRLEVSLNPDGTLKPTELNIGFVLESSAIISSAVDGAWVIISGDRTNIYVADRRVRINSDDLITTFVTTSSYDAMSDQTTIEFSPAAGVSVSYLEFSFAPNTVSRLYLVEISGSGLPVFTSNALAIAGGLSVGDFYQTGADPSIVAVVTL